MAQKLHGTYPLPAGKIVCPMTFVVCVICYLMSYLIWKANQQVIEFEHCYDDCPLNQNVVINIKLDRSWTENVYFYYKLYNFPLQHRRIHNGFYEEQLAGKKNYSNFTESPFRPSLFNKIAMPMVDVVDHDGKVYYPAGPLPNAIFNDTFKLFYYDGLNRLIPVPLTKQGLISDMEKRPFMSETNCSAEIFRNTVKPRSWTKRACDLPDGLQNTDFVVWMKPVAHDPFKKIYARLDTNMVQFQNGLPAGHYHLVINNIYPMMKDARKCFYMLRPSWYGHKDQILFKLCFFVGTVYLIIGIAFTAHHVKHGKTLEELSRLEEEEKKES